MNKNNIVPILSPKNAKEGLSKLQKQFNTKTKKIETLNEDIKHLEQIIPKAKLLINEELMSLRREIAEKRAEAVRIFDAAYEQKGLSKAQNEKIAHFITEHSFELIDLYGMKDLIPIFDSYAAESFEEIEHNSIESSKNDMQSFFDEMGLDIDMADWDLKNEEEMARKMAEILEEASKVAENQQKEAEEKQAKKKKTAKQIAQEEAKANREKESSKSIKEIYNQLVKAFHPDKELDIEKKAQKTEIMKEITAAYEKQDLFTLLKLQLQLEQIDLEKLNALTDEKIKHFIKVLDEQIKELMQQKDMMAQATLMSDKFGDFSDIFNAPKRYEQIIKSKKSEMLEKKELIIRDIDGLTDLKAIKAFFKDYSIAPSPSSLEELLAEMMFGKR